MRGDVLLEVINPTYRGNAYSPQDKLVYPPKMYFPTRIIVIVGPLLSQYRWKVVLAQPSTDASQQRLH